MLKRVVKYRDKMKEFMVECSLPVSGERLTLVASSMRFFPHPGARPLVLLTFEDITEHQRHERERERMVNELRGLNLELEKRVHDRTAELQAANEQLQALSRKVLETQEAERRYLARELHDEVGQALTGLNILLHRAASEAAPQTDREIQDARRIVGDLLKRVRQLSLDLRPAVLDDLGLNAAVQAHIDAFSKRTGVKVECIVEDLADEKMLPDVKITAFRCVQEALTNVARHANAGSASVRLQDKGENLFLEVADLGKGFTADKLPKYRGTGLDGMRERVALCGGQLELESAPNRGTRLSIRLPLKRERGAA
jgi:signal transduction histidine kinase